jgi:hypothetical protein
MASRSKTKSGFALTGKSKPAQFSERVKGQTETGFNQWNEKKATAAMQGRPPQGGTTKADAGPRRDAKKQFGNVPGKRVF